MLNMLHNIIFYLPPTVTLVVAHQYNIVECNDT